RTLLDPLSNDELRALREARQRMQAKKEPAVSAVAHQIVIGPDTGDDIGDAPTRSPPVLFWPASADGLREGREARHYSAGPAASDRLVGAYFRPPVLARCPWWRSEAEIS
ncbi:MAG: hypothetical protein AAFV29_27690, partial [Myxococcota bacterium]